MGIYDRDYIRPGTAAYQAAQPRRPRFSAGSVTTWIIVVCFAVFIVDGFLTPRVEVVRTFSQLPKEELRKYPGSDYKVDLAAARLGTLNAAGQFVPNPQAPMGYAPVMLGGNMVGSAEFRLIRPMNNLGYFSTAKAVAIDDPIYGWSGFQVWRFITFQFLHFNMDHVLFNMITLFFFGPMVETYLGRKRYLAFYLLCGCCGALMYLLLNGLAVGGQSLLGQGFRVPGLLFNDSTTPLIGASAGVFGVIMAAAFLAPNAEVLLFFFIPMRMRTLAYGLLCFAILAVWLGLSNAGGEAAHIGGAIAGFWFIRHPHQLHGFFDFLGRFDPTSRSAKTRVAVRAGTVSARDLDRILAKIKSEGLQSLTEAEKQTLREASRR
ncbi:MAG: rhomboid family intramembrane serine protease [Phycisphaerales bacterium]